MVNRPCAKLAFKFFGPYKIIEKIGSLAYKLYLPPESQIHPVFHVSQLKKHVGPKAVPCVDLPLVRTDGLIQTEPVMVLETRQVPRNNLPVVQWLVQWENLPPDEASWEDAAFIKKTFPAFFKATIDRWFDH